MPRRLSAKAMPSRRQRCSGGSQSLPVAQWQRVLLAQLAVVVDLAIGDQRGGAGEERLVAGGEVDDGEARVGQRDAARHVVPGAVRAAMRQRAGQRVHAWRRRARGPRGGPCRRGRTSGAASAARSAARRSAGSRASAPAPARRRARARTPRGRRRRGRRGAAASASSPAMAAASGSGASIGTSSPVSPSRTSSRGPCAAAATTGRAADHASSTTLPSGSWRDGQTKTSQAASSAPGVLPPAEEGDAVRHAQLPRQRFQRRALRPLAGEGEVRAAAAARGRAAARRSPCCGAAGRAPAAAARRAAQAGRRARRRRSPRAKFGTVCARSAGQPCRTSQSRMSRVLPTRWSQRR